MVRLEAVVILTAFWLYTFQFLVVRLEAGGWYHSPPASMISIPCGAIRSSSKNFTFGLNFISIPCGAIRSKPDQLKASCFTAFQFLVVRLEVRLPLSALSLFQISIPCGAIRSFTTRTARFFHSEFQFLVVRLEDFRFGFSSAASDISIPCGAIRSAQTYEETKNSYNFNSLWCD